MCVPREMLMVREVYTHAHVPSQRVYVIKHGSEESVCVWSNLTQGVNLVVEPG